MRRLPLLAGLGCLGGLLIACYGSLLFQDHLPAYRDAAHFYYPLYLRVQQEWEAGRIPLWEPEENSGMPLLGNPTAAVLYPGKLLYAVAPNYAWGTRLYTVSHTVLAVVGTFVLLRSWRVSRAGSGIGALAYGFGAPILFQYCNIIFLVGAAWLPLGLRAADQWLRLGRRWSLGELALILAMQSLGGDPQTAYVLGLCAGGYAIGLGWSQRSGRKRWPTWLIALGGILIVLAWSAIVLYAAYQFPRWRPERPGNRPPAIPLPWMVYVNWAIRAFWAIGFLGLAFAWVRKRGLLPTRLVGLLASAGLAASLMAVQLLPVMEFTGQTSRAAGQGPHDIYPFSLEPARLVEWAFPNFFGTSFYGNCHWLALIPPGHAPEVWVPSLYLGGITLVLALSALGFKGGPPWRSWLTAIALVSLLASLGKFGSPIWLVRNLPGMAEIFGRHDIRTDTAIRLDKFLRDGDGGFYWLLATILPGFREFRYPSKLLTFTCLALASLAGIGWDRLVRGERRRAIQLTLGLLGFGLVGLVVALAGRARIIATFAGSALSEPTSALGPFEPEGAWLGLTTSLGQASVVALSLLGIFWLARSRPKLAGTLALALLSLDLAFANARQVLTAPRAMFETSPKLLQIIEQAEQADPSPDGLFRVHRTPLWNPYSWREEASDHRFRDFLQWERKTLQPKYGIPYGLAYTLSEGTAELYDYMFFFSIFEGIHGPEIGQRFLGDPSKRVLAHSRRGFDLWNTKYFILPFVQANDEQRSILSFLHESDLIAPENSKFEGEEGQPALDHWQRAEDWQVRRNRRAYPRAWTVHQVKVQTPIRGLERQDRANRMEEILFQNDPLWRVEDRAVYDPKTLAWVETDDLSAFARFQTPSVYDPAENPRFSLYEPQRIEMTVDLKRPGLVILADVYYPGWKLTIDGQPSKIYRTNRMMRGALVEAGRHTLVYTYEPDSFRNGALLSFLGLIALGMLGAWSWRRPTVAMFALPGPSEENGASQVVPPEGSGW